MTRDIQDLKSKGQKSRSQGHNGVNQWYSVIRHNSLASIGCEYLLPKTPDLGQCSNVVFVNGLQIGTRDPGNEKWTRKCGNYSNVLPLEAADTIACPTQHLWGFKSELQTNTMMLHLELVWVATLMLHRGCVMDWNKQNKIVRVHKNSGPVLSRLWAKVHEIMGQRRRPFVLANAVAWLSMSRFVQQICAIKFQSWRKVEQM